LNCTNNYTGEQWCGVNFTTHDGDYYKNIDCSDFYSPSGVYDDDFFAVYPPYDYENWECEYNYGCDYLSPDLEWCSMTNCTHKETYEEWC
jgi:hypothetical protein